MAAIAARKRKAYPGLVTRRCRQVGATVGTRMGTAASATAREGLVRARYPATQTRASGIMLFGSVPVPPKKPKSSTSTQSAAHRMTAATTPMRTGRGRAVTSAAPITASASTAPRLIPHPCAASKVSKLATQDESRCGWGVWDICWTIPVRVPVPPVRVTPPQKPRPGQACNTAMPTKKSPRARRIPRPSRGVAHDREGSARSAPAAQ